MLQTLLGLCLALSGKAVKRSTPRRRPAFPRPACRPRLEALEERCLLSAGALDPTFGNGIGYVTTALGNTSDFATSALIQPDGKIIAVGETTATTGKYPHTQTTHAVGLVRYNTDGSLDTHFGNAGKVIGPAHALGNTLAALYPAAGTGNDGKIVVGDLAGGFSIARYNTDGTLDTSFGSQGIATANFASTSSWDVFSEVIQSDGKIVALGQTADGTQGQLARFNANGSLDTSFGQGGMVTGPDCNPYSLLLQADGKVIMVGATYATYGESSALELIRYNTDGTLDTSFGSSGIVTNSSFSYGFAAAFYPNAGTANDGKFIVEGSGAGRELARYNPDGSLDSSFGDGGTFATPPGAIGAGGSNTQGVVIQPDGPIIVAGGGSNNSFAAARYNVDGGLDSTFGSGGVATAVSGSPGYGEAVALQSDGAIVVAGWSNNGTNNVFTVARFLGGSTPVPKFSVTGLSSTTAGVAFSFTVTAEDASGQLNTGYTGTIHFTSTDPNAVLPADYTFIAHDQGVHTFSVTLKTSGFQGVNVMDGQITYWGGETVNAAAAVKFYINDLLPGTLGTATTCKVIAVDQYGNWGASAGTVHFTSSDPLAVLPADYTFTAADGGIHIFSVTFNTAGTEWLTVTDTLNSSITGSTTVTYVAKKKGH